MPTPTARLRYTVSGPTREQPPLRRDIGGLNVWFTRSTGTADHLRHHPRRVRRRKAPAARQGSRPGHRELQRWSQERERREESPGRHRREEERVVGWSDQPCSVHTGTRLTAVSNRPSSNPTS